MGDKTLITADQQIVYYEGANPIKDGVVPVDQDSPGIAMPRNGAGNWFQWDVDRHEWLPR